MDGKVIPTLEETWAELTKGLDKAFACKSMEPKEYIGYYSTVYNYCTAISSSDVGCEIEGTLEFVGQQLYDLLEDYVKTHVRAIGVKCKELSDESLLDYYTDQWEKFRFSSTVTDGMFSYLNRHWVRREHDEGRQKTYMIYTLCLMTWRKHLFDPLEQKLMDAVLELIHRHRLGQRIETKYIKLVVDNLVELGYDDDDDGKKKDSDTAKITTDCSNSQFAPVIPPKKAKELEVYKTSFEKRFLEATRDFYVQESLQLLSGESSSCIEYMKKVETRIQEEENRCHLCLHATTLKPLSSVYDDVLISRQLDFIQGYFGPLLVNQQDEHLGRMYNLCCRVPHGLDALRSALEKHVAKEGHCAMGKIEKEGFNDPKLYINTLLEVHERYHELVSKSFKKEAGFTASLDRAASNFVNSNAVTKLAPPPSQSLKSAELICRYTDQLFKKSSKMPDEMEMEVLQNKVLVIFKYLDDKDIFLKYYTKMYSKRLINDLSASDEAEQSFISKLTTSCGYEFTTRLSKMCQDIQVSKDFTNDFKEKNEKILVVDGKKSIEFQSLVLSSGSWPNFPECTLTLPQQLSNTIEAFNRYYQDRFNGRRLQWVYSQCRGEVTATAFKGKKYVFGVTTPQMCTLLLFNEQNSYTANGVMQATGMDAKTCQMIIKSLLTNLIFKSDKEMVGDELPWDANLTLNTAYNNKKVKVDLSKITMKQEAVKDTESVQKHADEDRKNVISAAIVRIMKTRKSFQHSQLLAEVISQLQGRFKPKVDMIKRCIGMLIEKEYLRRSDEARDMYEYLA